MVEEALKYRKEMNYANASDSELAAFVAYAKVRVFSIFYRM